MRNTSEFYSFCTLQTHHGYFMLMRRENNRFHVVSSLNARGVFVGKEIFGGGSIQITTDGKHHLKASLGSGKCKN